MIKGEAIGDEIYLASGVERTANFDLSKAPAAPPPAAAGKHARCPPMKRRATNFARRSKKKPPHRRVMYKAFEEAKTAYTAKNYEEAITKFKFAIEKIPVPPPAGAADVIWANLAKTYDATKQWPESAGAYKKAIEYKPTESNYYLNLSLAQIANGELEESQASIQKAAELNPANAGMAYYNMGATLINRNQPKEAITFFKKAIELDPKYANAYYQLGLTYIGTGKMEEAAPVLQKYLELVPTGQDAETAKALIEATKATAPTSVQNPAPGKAPAKQPSRAARKAKPVVNSRRKSGDRLAPSEFLLGLPQR